MPGIHARFRNLCLRFNLLYLHLCVLHCPWILYADVFFTQWRYLATLAFLHQFPYLTTTYIGGLHSRPYSVIIIYHIYLSTFDTH